MHLNPYGEYAVLLAASLANDWPAVLNAQMAAATAYPQLTDHDNEGWHLHYRDADARSLPEVLSAVISVGTALHLTTRGMEWADPVF